MQAQHPGRSPDIAGLLGVLERHGVRYVLAGSVAALAYGVDIGQAGDLDIIPALDAKNLSQLAAALRDIEAELDPDAPFGHWEKRPDGEKQWIVDAPTPEIRAQRASWSPDPSDVSTFDSVFHSRLGNFDIVPEISGTYDILMRRAVRMRLWSVDVWVIHIDELLAMVTTPRRPKDAPRVRQLRAIQRQRGESPQSNDDAAGEA